MAVTWVDKNRATGTTHLDLCRAFGAARQDILVCKQERRDLTSGPLGEIVAALKVTLKVSCSQWFKCPSAELW